MKPASAPNLRQIAKAAKVSHTTVSLALRNHPRVSERMKRRIRALAEKMGYRPNALVAALMSQIRSNRHVVTQEVVAFLTGGPTPDWWQGWPSIAQSHAGALARAEQLGFRLEPFWMGPGGHDARRVAKVLRARAIRGAIMAPLPVPHANRIDLDWERCAVSAIGYSFEQVPLHRAAHHHAKSVMTLYQHLRQLGYQRIGLAATVEDLVRVKHFWLAGFLAGRELFGGARLPHVSFDGTPEKHLFFDWMDRYEPDIVIGVARDTYFWLKEAGLRLPEDVAYAHLNLLDVRPHKVAGIEQNSAAIGAAATDLLVGQLYHNEYGFPSTPQCTLIDGRWMPGPTAPAKQAAPAKKNAPALLPAR
jgi:LacI family transcriptional regulator